MRARFIRRCTGLIGLRCVREPLPEVDSLVRRTLTVKAFGAMDTLAKSGVPIVPETPVTVRRL